jgi:hypothetical protein
MCCALFVVLALGACSSEDEPTSPTSAPPTIYFWEARVPLGFSDFQAVGVAAKDTLFLAIANDPYYDTTDVLKTTLVSYDGGEVWQYGGSLKDTIYHALQKYDQTFYAVSDQSIFKSTDGKTWTLSTWAGTGDSTRCGCVLFDIARGSSGFVAVARRYLAFSQDGNSWGLISSVDITNDNVWFTRVTFDGSRYIVLARNFTKNRTEFYESPDGLTWSMLGSLPLTSMNDIVWSDSGFVAVGDTGSLYTSKDAVSWDPVDVGTLADLRFVEWGNGQYIAGGTYGTLLVSNDGSGWKAQSHNDQHTLLAANWTGDRYVVVGENVILVTYLPLN